MKSLAVFIFLNICGGTLATLCTYYSFGDTYTKYCSHGCCGSTYSTVCCTSYVTVSVGVVAGGVIGGICGLAVLIAILIIICRRRNRTIVYQQHGCHDHVTTVTGTTTMAPYPQQGGYTNPPPPYRY